MNPWVTDFTSCHIFDSVDSIYCFMRNRKKNCCVLVFQYFHNPISSRAQLSFVTRRHIFNAVTPSICMSSFYWAHLIPFVLSSSSLSSGRAATATVASILLSHTLSHKGAHSNHLSLVSPSFQQIVFKYEWLNKYGTGILKKKKT